MAKTIPVYNPDTRKLETGVPTVANQAANATTAATDDATVWALANALKTDLNALLAKLKAAGIMIADT